MREEALFMEEDTAPPNSMADAAIAAPMTARIMAYSPALAPFGFLQIATHQLPRATVWHNNDIPPRLMQARRHGRHFGQEISSKK